MQDPKDPGSIPEHGVDSIQAAVLTVQKSLCRYNGSLVQFRCDEKGFLCICAFGLPGRSHEDSPSRAVQAALTIIASMKKLQQVAFVST